MYLGLMLSSQGPSPESIWGPGKCLLNKGYPNNTRVLHKPTRHSGTKCTWNTPGPSMNKTSFQCGLKVSHGLKGGPGTQGGLSQSRCHAVGRSSNASITQERGNTSSMWPTSMFHLVGCHYWRSSFLRGPLPSIPKLCLATLAEAMADASRSQPLDSACRHSAHSWSNSFRKPHANCYELPPN